MELLISPQFNKTVVIKLLIKTASHDYSLGPHKVLIFEGRPLQVDDSQSPKRNMKDPPDLDVHLSGAKDHHIVVLHTHKRKNTAQKAWVSDVC